MQRGELFIVSAPSGAGKTTIIRRLMGGPLGHSGRLVYSVSHTSRQPRRGEVEGRDYHFIDIETFERMASEGAFLEWAEVHGEFKGTSREQVMRGLESGLDVLLDIDVQGAEQLLEKMAQAHSVFILPPSYDELERRLRNRGLDRAEAIARRLAVSLWEIERYKRYDYVIINDDLERASDTLAAIILDKQHRLDRMQGRVASVVEDFERRIAPDGGR
jgi:guanylate kinase